MSKYIDIEKVQHLIVETGNKHSRDGEDIHTCSSICADLVISVYELPTVDVQEVRHGQWININGDRSAFKCSICGEISCCNSLFCGDCGARMDVEE